jgi:hypothetical protein
METKVCNYCGIEKKIEFFTKSKARCRICLAAIKREKYKENPEPYRRWAKNNPEKVKENGKNWVKKNPEKNKLKKQKYNLKNKEKNNEYSQNWRKNNPDYKKKYNEKNREKLWETEKKRRENFLVKLSNNIRCRVTNYLKSKNIKKNNKTFDIVGCTPEILKEHLEKQFIEGMCWDNYGKFGWHIDHIIPLSSASSEEEIFKLCHYTNLQPLWAFDNLSKGNKIII